jgi:hypothetical protein
MGPSYPFAIAGDVCEFVDPSRTAYVFCLLASLPEQLKPLRTSYPQDFRDLFEAVVAESLRRSMPGWTVYATGWSASAAGGKNTIVTNVVNWTLAKHSDPSVFPNANDAQIDIAMVRTFSDGRSAFPVILGQCATGARDWKSKASRPNLDRWAAAVQFSSQPLKLFSVPFALDDSSFWEATTECRGLVLDRTRICEPLSDLPVELDGAITDWIDQAVTFIPLAA